MAQSPWKKLPLFFPTDEQHVWCRLVYSFTPFQADYDATADTFTTTNGHTLPWYYVCYWKPDTSR